MKRINKLTAQDWIILRLVYFVLAVDPSSIMVRDINKTRDYIDAKYGRDTVLKAFELIRREHMALDEYDNPASNVMRGFQKMVNGVLKDLNVDDQRRPIESLEMIDDVGGEVWRRNGGFK